MRYAFSFVLALRISISVSGISLPKNTAAENTPRAGSKIPPEVPPQSDIAKELEKTNEHLSQIEHLQQWESDHK